jgi:hypothetical protein
MNFFQRAALLTKDPKNVEGKRQAAYPWISLADIPPASALLFYNGNKVTERAGMRLFGHRYWPPAFHAALYLEEGRFLNVGKFKTIELVERQLRSTRRVDVVIYKALSAMARRDVVGAAYRDTSSPKVGFMLPDYAVTDYLRFLVKAVRPSKKDFCSENVVEAFAAAGLKVSDQEPFNTAPWDLQEWAEARPEVCELRTLWVGSNYPF